MKNSHYDIREECLFLTAFILWLTGSALTLTRWQDIDMINSLCGYLEKLAYVFWIAQFLLKKKYTKKDCVGIALIIVTAVLAYHSVYQRNIIPCMVMIYLSGNINFRKILKCAWLIQMLILAATILGSKVGLILNDVWETDLGRVRYDLGYEYCAYPAHIALFVTTGWFVVCKKFRFFDAGIWLLFNTLIFLWTDSRTDYYLTVFAILGFAFLPRWIRTKRAERRYGFWLRNSCTFLAAVSILTQWLYDSEKPWMAEINRALSNRLLLGYNAIQEIGFTVFGQSVKWIGSGSVRNNSELVYNYVDCAYLKEALSYGIFFLGLLIVGFYLAGKKIAESEEWRLGWGMIISLFYAVFNAHLCWVNFNVFILVLGLVFRNGSGEKEIGSGE